MLSAATGSSQPQVQSAPLAPAYDDYGLRHPLVVQSAPIGTESDDYGLRHPLVVQSAPIGTESDDYGLRHPLVVQSAPIGTESDDYGLRHPLVVQSAPIGTESDDYGLRHPRSVTQPGSTAGEAGACRASRTGGHDISNLTPATGPTTPDGTPRPPQSEAYRLPLHFQLLGPLEVTRDGGRLPLGGPKQRLVLAHLLIRANELVSTDLLIDEIWGDEPPDAARQSLHSYVSHLRKALGSDRLEGRPPGYVLNASDDEIDAKSFQALVAQARRRMSTDPVSAARTIRQALALWRGDALADLSIELSLAAGDLAAVRDAARGAGGPHRGRAGHGPTRGGDPGA